LKKAKWFLIFFAVWTVLISALPVSGISGCYFCGSNVEEVALDECRVAIVCRSCKRDYGLISDHVWASNNCVEGIYCKQCNANYPEELRHSYKYSLLLFFSFCTVCHQVGFQIPPLPYIFALFGLLITVAALVFVLLNRKSIRVQGGKYIRTATPDAHLKESDSESHLF